jgi:hypothetical protein
MLRPILCLLPALLLAGCGDLPEPFLGNPGRMGRVLSQPPAQRLAVPPPGNALLPDASSAALASDLATALLARQVPAVAGTGGATDWRLIASATDRGSAVVPTYTVVDPQGKQRGQTEGAPVPVAVWAAASPATLRSSADNAAPKIASLLTNIQTALQMADPNSLYHRQAKVMVADVTGAPGDGDESLTRQMRARLALLGPDVQTSPKDVDYTVRGVVTAVPVPGRQQRIEIDWLIKNAKGQDLGKVVQLKEIPAGTLDNYWGDVAVVVATEAAGGIDHVLKLQTPKPAPAAVEKAAVRGQSATPLVEGRQSGGVEPVQ